METVNWITPEKAAGLFLVAWVKDWPLIDLVNVFSQRRLLDGVKLLTPELAKEMGSMYSFMPSTLQGYVIPQLGKRSALTFAKRFVADNYPKLNDALWDAPDNQAILALKDRVLRLKCPEILKSRKFSKEELAERNRTARAAKAEQSSYAISREIFKRRKDGSDWKTVK